jgi:hypothetical protein
LRQLHACPTPAVHNVAPLPTPTELKPGRRNPSCEFGGAEWGHHCKVAHGPVKLNCKANSPALSEPSDLITVMKRRRLGMALVVGASMGWGGGRGRGKARGRAATPSSSEEDPVSATYGDEEEAARRNSDSNWD